MKWLSDAAVGRLRAAADAPDLSGTKYRLVEPLGRGGMGTVYVAEDPDLGRLVALKVVTLGDAVPRREAKGLDRTALTRIRNEARILARLEHPGIVPVHDLGTLPDGRVFYVMKLVRGLRLDEHARREPASPLLLRLFERICEAVAFAHAHGVIHRDLKPENVMVGPFGEVLVLDWGVARWNPDRVHSERETVATENRDPEASGSEIAARDQGPTSVATSVGSGSSPGTAFGTILGTPGYMAPEQARGETDAIDERTDVYALGAMLSFLLRGEPPEAGAADEAPGSPRPGWPPVPRPLDAVVRKAMSADPPDRYAGAREMAEDVSRYLSGLPVAALPESLLDHARRLVRRHKTPILLVFAYLLMRALLLWYQTARR